MYLKRVKSFDLGAQAILMSCSWWSFLVELFGFSAELRCSVAISQSFPELLSFAFHESFLVELLDTLHC